MTEPSVTSRDIRDPDEPITCLTCYDYLTARVMDQVSELDMILVGDSLGMVVLGQDDTLSVTVDDIVHHTRSVARGVNRAFLVADVPFMEMARSRDHLVSTVQRIVGEGGAQSVKIEGGEKNASAIEHIVSHDVPVVGHLGLTPQSVEALGGYRVQGQSEQEIKELARDARILDNAGVIAIVLECVPSVVARRISDAISVPTIGIGAGEGCGGQVLVWQDMMGLTEGTVPSFVRTWGDFRGDLQDGVSGFCRAVRDGTFPGEDESFSLPGEITEDQVDEWVSPS